MTQKKACLQAFSRHRSRSRRLYPAREFGSVATIAIRATVSAMIGRRDARAEGRRFAGLGVFGGPFSTGSCVSAKKVDAYLRALEEPKRSTLQALRRTILEIVPDAEQVISYRVPAFRLGGKTIAGFAAFKDHLSYLPFSGSVLGQLADDLDGYTMTKSALHFPVDRPLSKTLVKRLIRMRLAEINRRAG
jgi:uncharacterized protein YdhG (YjbR/CyaY superfamily)